MKFIKQIIMTILLMVVPVSGFAFQNEPIGFRDLYWGETLEEVKQGREVKYFEYIPKSNSVMYLIHLNPDESKTLSQVPIFGEGFATIFWNDKLWAITLFFNEEDAFSDLKFAMTQLYGEPQHNEWNRCWWVGETTLIRLEKDQPNKNMTCLSLVSNKIMMDLSKEQVSQGW